MKISNKALFGQIHRWLSYPMHVLKVVEQFLQSGYVDPRWYSQQYKIPSSLAVWHWITLGVRKRYDPSEKFSTSAYLQAYSDVRISGANPLRHFLKEGQQEGRSPKPSPTWDYSEWILEYGALKQTEREQLLYKLKQSEVQPRFSIIVPVYNPRKRDLKECLQSVIQQSYPNWELCIVDDASKEIGVRAQIKEFETNKLNIQFKVHKENQGICKTTNDAIAMATGDYIVFLDHDDVLTTDALLWFAEALYEHPNAILLYSDEDQISSKGERFNPFFKPDWSPERLRRQNYINHATVCKRKTVLFHQGVRENFEGSQDHDFLLRVTETLRAEQIVHIPRVCYSWRIQQNSQSSFSQQRQRECQEKAANAVQEHLQRMGLEGTVQIEYPGFLKVYYSLEEQPLVSLIIPTRDRLDLLKDCVDGVINNTTYQPIEVIIIDNGSVENATLQYLQKLKDEHENFLVIRDEGPFNFSRLNNKAVKLARGDVIGLLNNDLKFVEDSWLEELVMLAAQPGVGAVGPKLLYEDSRIQHVGLVLGVGGVAGHSYRKRPADYLGGIGSPNSVVHEVIGVTGACMIVKKATWDQVRGLDEKNLAIAFNDVDFCLKLHEAGYRNLISPRTKVYHLESASRGPEIGVRKKAFAEELQFMKTKWKHILQADPFYNINLSIVNEQHEISDSPRDFRVHSDRISNQ